MTPLERVRVAPMVEKRVENRLRWFGHVDIVVRRVDQMEESQIKRCRGRGRPRKTIRETIKSDLEVNELDPNIVYDRTLWRNLIHVADLSRIRFSCCLFDNKLTVKDCLDELI